MVDTPGTEKSRDYGLSEEQAAYIFARYGFGPAQFRQQSDARQRRILSRIQFGDLALQRAQHAALFRRGDDGEIAVDGHARAAKRLNEMRATQPFGGSVAGMSVGALAHAAAPIIAAPSEGLAPNNTGWNSLGPGNAGGRIRSIVINPTTGNIYVGSVSGGVWISTDDGQTWEPTDDLMANLAIGSMAMVRAIPTTIYAGTGEGFKNNGAVQGNGIFKTTDGWTWKQLATTAGNANFQYVNGLTVNSDGSVVLAGTGTGIFRSINGGDTWAPCLTAPGNVGNIEFDPNNNTKAVAGMLGGGGIRYSTDGGANWNAATLPPGIPPIGRIQVCYALQDTAHTVYASVETNPGDDPSLRGSQIWRSSDAGQSFTKVGNTVNYLGTLGWYANVIWAGDPRNPDFVIVGGLDLYRSMDGGRTLTPISDWLYAPLQTSGPYSAHADHHVIRSGKSYDGQSDNTVYFGNDGGIFKTIDVRTVGNQHPPDPDRTYGWVSLNSKLPITQFYSVAGKFTTPGGVTTITSVVGGTQDNGNLRYTPANGTNAWNQWRGGDGGYVASHPTRDGYYFGESPFFRVMRSIDGGASAELICGYNVDTGLWKLPPYSITDAQPPAKTLFVPPFILDPNNPDWLIAGGESLWRTTGNWVPNTATDGPSWYVIKVGVAGSLISAIAIAPSNSNIALVGQSTGEIYKSINAMNPGLSVTWSRIDAGIGATRMCTSLTIDKDNSNRLYATFAGFQTNNIWTSANGGTSWTSLGGTLPPAPIYCLAIHPQNSQWLYLGTETGIFTSEDGGQNWSPSNEGPTNCVVYQFTWMNSTLLCATHGRGIFAIDLTIRQARLVVTGDMGGNVSSFYALDGTPASTPASITGSIFADPVIDGASIYCAYQQPSKVTKFRDARNLSAVAWEKTLDGGIMAAPCLAKAVFPGDPDVLYVMAGNGKLTALDAANGNKLWDLAIVNVSVTAYSCQMMNQWLYIATDRGLYAVNLQARTVPWSQPYVCKAPLLIAANSVFAGAQDGKIYAVDARTGVQLWSFDTGNVVGSTPVWVLGSIIAGNQSGKLVGLNYRTGAKQFEANFPNEQIEAIAARGNVIYFAGNAQNGHFYAYRLDPATRAISAIWTQPPALALGAASPPQIDGTTVYLTTLTGYLVAYNPANGGTRWAPRQLPRGAIALASPALGYL